MRWRYEEEEKGPVDETIGRHHDHDIELPTASIAIVASPFAREIRSHLII